MYVGVVGTGPVGEVRIEAEVIVQEGRLGGDGVLCLTVGVLAVARSVEDVTDGIYAAVGEGAVRVEDRRAGVAFIRDVTPDVTAGFALRLGHHVVAVCDVGVGSDLEPGSDLVAYLHAAVVHLVGVGVHLTVEQTVVVVETGGYIVVELVVRAGDGEVVGLGEGEILIEVIVVVGSLVIVEPAALGADGAVGNEGFVVSGLGPLAIFVQPCHGELHGLVDGGRVAAFIVVPGIVEVLCPGVTVGNHIRHGGRSFERQVGLVGHGCRSLLGILGGDEHHAVRSAGAVDCGGCGILQHGNTLDIVRVQEAGVALDTVDEHQSAAALSDRGFTADVE